MRLEEVFETTLNQSNVSRLRAKAELSALQFSAIQQLNHI